MIKFSVNHLIDVEDSNFFLRSFWANIRKSFGKLAWQLMAMKIPRKQEIFLGYIDIDIKVSGAISVTVTYKRKGMVSSIIFDNFPTENEDQLRLCFEQTKANYKNGLNTFFASVKLESDYPFTLYQTENYKFENRELIIRVKGFDEEDSKKECLEKLQQIKWTLSSYYRVPIKLLSVRIAKNSNIFSTPTTDLQVFYDDIIPNRDDDAYIHNGKCMLTKNIAKTLDLILVNFQSEKLKNTINAFRLFHSGLRLEKESHKHALGDMDYSEVIHALYMSCLEVLADDPDFKPEKCNECGQLRYSISKKVKDKAIDVYGENSLMVADIVNFYAMRSKLLHTGSFFSKSNYTGVTIPTLNTSKNGVDLQCYFDGNLKHIIGRFVDDKINEFIGAYESQQIIEQSN